MLKAIVALFVIPSLVLACGGGGAPQTGYQGQTRGPAPQVRQQVQQPQAWQTRQPSRMLLPDSSVRQQLTQPNVSNRAVLILK